MANALVRQEQPIAAQIEQVVISGDLKTLTPAQRVDYYNRVCQSVGLNPYTRPFEYITLNGKLTLYARRDAADQLRSLHGISLSKPHIEYTDDMVIVTVEAIDKERRTDTDLGAVSIKNLQGENRANAIMKAITKAKRRVTLSLAGLGWLDETEVDSIPGAQRVTVDTETGEIIDATVSKPSPDVDFGQGQRKQPAPLTEEEVTGVGQAVAASENAPRASQTGKATVEGNGTPVNPFEDSNAPDDAEAELLDSWKSPADAHAWAVAIGACENIFEAQNSFKNLVNERFGGKCTKTNIANVHLAYMRKQEAKLEELFEKEQAEPEAQAA